MPLESANLTTQAVGIAILALLWGCVLSWSAIVSRAWRGVPIVRYEFRASVPWGPVEVLLVMLVLAGVQVALGGILFRGSPDDAVAAAAPDAERPGGARAAAAGDDRPRDGARLLLADGLSKLIALPIAWLLLRCRAWATNRDLGLSLRRVPYDLALGGAAFAAVIVPIYALQALLATFIPPEHVVEQILAVKRDTFTIVVACVTAVVVAPLAEEFFFRVVLQGWFEALAERRAAARAEQQPAPPLDARSGAERSYLPADDAPTDDLARAASQALPASSAAAPARWPIVASSLLFAAVHVGNGPSPIPLFFFGLALGYLYRQTHRLLPAVVLHAALNASSMTLLLLYGA